MTKPITITDAATSVNEFIDSFTRDKTTIARRYDERYERLWREIGIYLLAGGKRIRPYLILLTYQAYGGNDLQKAIKVAAAWEFLHASLLVHDDIIDRDLVRHGAPNISGVYKNYYGNNTDADHFANGAALLAGDLLLSSAHEMIATAEFEDTKKSALQQLLSEALFGVAGGELMDTEAVLENLDKVDARKIAEYKTAEYSCEYPILCGALLSDVSQDEVKKLKQMARSIGIGYQLVDDLLGIFGAEELTGKTNTGDIREKKRTLLVQYTYELLDAGKKTKLNEIYNSAKPLSDQDIAWVKQAIEDSGSKEKVIEEIDIYQREALTIAETLSINDTYRAEYRKLVKKLLSRDN